MALSSARRASTPTWLHAAALIIVGVALRLPQLLSPNLLLEGDECILGLMGLHVARGREFPMFFYGQQYGLAIVEAPAAALAFLLGGVGPVQLKLAILAVWTAGTCFYYLAFSRVLGGPRSFWVALLLASIPAWAAASMKAWSGYITAYGVTGLCLYVITRNGNRGAPPWIVAGALSAVVYFAHALWLPSLVPVVVYFLWTSRRRVFWASYLAGVLGVALVVLGVKAMWYSAAIPAWVGPTVGNPHLLASLPRILMQAYVNLTGSYYFGTAVPPGRITTIVAWVWVAVLALAVPVQVVRLITRQYLLWSHLLFLSALGTLAANWLLLDWRDARYMLALSAPLVFMAGVELFDVVDRRWVPARAGAAMVVLLLVLQAAAMTEFSRYTYMWWTNATGAPSETRTLRKTIDHLRSRGVTHAFAMNALLQWQITFYSGESVIARWKMMRERYPPYVAQVDRALDRGEPVAIVGYTGYTYGLERIVDDPQTIIDVDGKYFVYFVHDANVLRRAGFELPR
jgi:hypothetical protein